MVSFRSISIAAVASLPCLGQPAVAQSQDFDALFLGGYWCNTRTDVKTENIPRNRSFLLSRKVEEGSTSEAAFTERLIDITGDVRGQRIILAQKLKNSDGTECKSNCTIAERVVNRDLLEIGDWNSNTAVFKSNSPREYLHRCEK